MLGLPLVSGRTWNTHSSPPRLTAVYIQKVPEAPSCWVSTKNVWLTMALVSQLAVAAAPLARPRTCRDLGQIFGSNCGTDSRGQSRTALHVQASQSFVLTQHIQVFYKASCRSHTSGG